MSVDTLRAKTVSFLDRHLSGDGIRYGEVFALILPILVDQAFVLCMSLISTAMVSSSGMAAISAVNNVDSLNNLVLSVLIAVATGGTVVVAQYKGNKNDEMMERAASGCITAVFLLAFGISIVCILFRDPILTLLFGKSDADVFRDAQLYMLGCGISYCGFAVEQAVCAVLRGIGTTKPTLTLSLIMNGIFVFLNVILIKLMGLSIMGLVISNILARNIAALCSLVYLFHMNGTLRIHFRDLFHLRIEMLKKIFYIGVPYAAEQLFFNGGKLLTQTFIVSLGTYAIATNAICGCFMGLMQIPANTLFLAVVTVVGQCMGQRNIPDARKFTRSFLVMGCLSSLAICLLIISAFPWIVSLFCPPAKIVPNIFRITVITAIAQVVLWSASFIVPAALRAAGDATFSSVIAMLSMWLFRVVFGYVLGIVLSLGIFGVWLAMDLEWGVRGLIFLIRFKGSKWYRHDLISE